MFVLGKLKKVLLHGQWQNLHFQNIISESIFHCHYRPLTGTDDNYGSWVKVSTTKTKNAAFLLFQMNLLLKEYLTSGDVSEAERCLRDLEVPHFHHELVYEVESFDLTATD